RRPRSRRARDTRRSRQARASAVILQDGRAARASPALRYRWYGSTGPRLPPSMRRFRYAPVPASHQAVDLARQDEVVLVQALDLVREHRNRRIAPAEADIGMMALFLGDGAHLVDEVECGGKILEGELPLQAMSVIHERPARRALEIAARHFEAQGFDAATAG